jgi:hypothetical protein
MIWVLMTTIALLAGDGEGASSAPITGPDRVYEGVYGYDHGDWLQVECDQPKGCSHFIVRDQTLQRLLERRGDKAGRLKFIGEEVDACKDSRSSQIACLLAPESRAVVIKKWLYNRDMK